MVLVSTPASSFSYESKINIYFYDHGNKDEKDSKVENADGDIVMISLWFAWRTRSEQW